MFIGSGLIMNWYYWKRIGLDIIKFWKNILPIAAGTVLAAAIGFGIKLIFPSGGILLLALQIVLYCLIYAAVMWAVCLNGYEKGMIGKIFVKLKRH